MSSLGLLSGAAGVFVLLLVLVTLVLPAPESAFLTASIIPRLEYVAPETVSTLLPGLPSNLPITAFARLKNGASSLFESISTLVILPPETVTRTLIGPL